MNTELYEKIMKDPVLKSLYITGKDLSKLFNITQKKIDKALKEARKEWDNELDCEDYFITDPEEYEKRRQQLVKEYNETMQKLKDNNMLL